MAPGIAEKKNNVLPLWGNEKTMNLNNLILTNILSSHYFKVNLYQLKTYHEVIDEIYYQVTHLEPWEKGSRKTSGQTGMCGGVRGVGAGGIVSTAFCILYKLFTLKLTRKQVVGLINHADSPYIRALGFMYIRYTQPPSDLWEWYESYLSDPEELDVKAGGGQTMTIGEMLRHYLSKLEWFSTLFPRIPVPIQKDLERKLSDWRAQPENQALLKASEWAEESSQHEVVEEKVEAPPAKRERSPRRENSDHFRDEESRSHKRRHHSRDRERSRERSRHKTYDSIHHRKEHESDRHSEKHHHRHHSRDRKHERHHEHSKRHDKHSHSHRGHRGHSRDKE